jgi:hypothetical protein
MSRTSMLVIALLVLSPAAGTAGESGCKPVLTLKDVRFSEIISSKRHWTATVHADASACAASSGLFAVRFVRLAETAPDLEFAEPFMWHGAQTKIRVEFAADEAVQSYWIADVAACQCPGK